MEMKHGVEEVEEKNIKNRVNLFRNKLRHTYQNNFINIVNHYRFFFFFSKSKRFSIFLSTHTQYFKMFY